MQAADKYISASTKSYPLATNLVVQNQWYSICILEYSQRFVKHRITLLLNAVGSHSSGRAKNTWEVQHWESSM